MRYCLFLICLFTLKYSLLNGEERTFLERSSPLHLYSFYSAGKSPGIEENYAAIGFFYVPYFSTYGCATSLDAALLHFANGSMGASAETGIRMVDFADTIVVALHLIYGYREGTEGDYHQLGFNIELIRDCFEIRGNGYFPIGKKVGIGPLILFNNYDNTDVEVPYEATVFKEEFALTGFDVECGFRCSVGTLSAYGGIGTYFFDRSPFLEFRGVKSRVRAEWGKFLYAEGQITWDHYHGTEGRFMIACDIPLNCMKNFCDCLCPPHKSQRRSYRDLPIHIAHCCEYTTNY